MATQQLLRPPCDLWVSDLGSQRTTESPVPFPWPQKGPVLSPTAGNGSVGSRPLPTHLLPVPRASLGDRDVRGRRAGSAGTRVSVLIPRLGLSFLKHLLPGLSPSSPGPAESLRRRGSGLDGCGDAGAPGTECTPRLGRVVPPGLLAWASSAVTRAVAEPPGLWIPSCPAG